MKKFNMPSLLTGRFATGIDLGSSKFCCWTGVWEREEEVKIIGAGHAAARGIEGGNLVDVGALESQITAAIYEAERQSNVQIHQAVVTLNGHFFYSDYHVLKSSIYEGVVTQKLLDQLWGRFLSRHQDYFPLHFIPLEFCVDDQDRIKDPRGMSGVNLMCYCHVVWVHKGRFNTLVECLKRCQIQLSGLLLGLYSSGLACLTSDEQELGATIIDMGAQSTGMGFFFQGRLVGSKTVKLGGDHITQDIARGCETPIQHAERIKVLYGAALPTSSDHKEMIPVASLGGGDTMGHIARSFLINIIQARSEEICRMMKMKMDEVCATQPFSCQRIVLTGGGSQLPGMRELVAQVLERPVRIAKSYPLKQAPRVCGEFSAVSGTFFYQDAFNDFQCSALSSFIPNYRSKSFWSRLNTLFKKEN
ncbi:cell division protein FtsA [Holospora curviuscula]|uniref:Cell division protein FtsA n=1 Tax=Holospora curviuscula TaxID=1082868 RepID=A0A2S5R9N5_9PROT|nr:cell division protein FtsA [Holospora curviuscula]PPE04013.1 Cell division protein FtsA [Holospora curviuscula]